MGVVIKLVEQGDFPRIDALRRKISNSERFRLHPCRYLLKATVDRAIIGTVGMEYHGHYALLRDLFVVKEYRRKGVGSALIKKCFEICQRDGIQGVYLLTYWWNIKFFCPLGFQLIRRRKGIPSEIGNCWQFREKAYNRCVSLGLLLWGEGKYRRKEARLVLINEGGGNDS